jgi:hypothetical protein
VRVYPTIIVDCQARLAHGSQAEAIASKLRHLSEQRGTAAQWDPASRSLLLRPGAGA